MDYFLFNFSGVQFHYTMSQKKITQKAKQNRPSLSVFLQIAGKDGFSYSPNAIYCSIISEYYFRLAIAAAVSSAP